MADYTATQMADAVSLDTTRDMIIMDMFSNHGYTLNGATKRFAELAKELGIATGKASRQADAMAMLTTDAPMSAADIKDECDGVANNLGIKPTTVQGYLKMHYEAQDWNWPAVGSESEAILDWLTDNHECGKAAFEVFMRTAGKDGAPRSSSNVNEYWKGMILHRRIMAKLDAAAAE